MSKLRIALCVVITLPQLSACIGSRQISADTQARLAERYPGKYTVQLADVDRRRAVNLTDGALYSVDRFGRTNTVQTAESVISRVDGRFAVFLVHGTMYDINGNDLYQPHLTIYEFLRNQLSSAHNTVGIGWASVRFSAGNLPRAWRRGHWSWYGLAAERALGNAQTLAPIFAGLDRPFAVVCHSIGCDLAYRALASQPTRVVRLLMLSPDTDYQAVFDWAKREQVRVLHATASNDRALRYSKYARVNQQADVRVGSPHYEYLEIDMDNTLPGRRRFSFDYANPRRFWDHMAALESEELWDRYRDFVTVSPHAIGQE